MPRSKGQDGMAIRVRADLEGVLGHLADHDECTPRVVLRIRQAIKRTGLTDLLSPALEDLDRITRDIQDVRSQVRGVVDRLSE